MTSKPKTLPSESTAIIGMIVLVLLAFIVLSQSDEKPVAPLPPPPPDGLSRTKQPDYFVIPRSMPSMATPSADVAAPAPTAQPLPVVPPGDDVELDREDDHHPPSTTVTAPPADSQPDEREHDRGGLGDGKLRIWRWFT